MDRFIGKEIILTADMDEKFKIQYGQIYSSEYETSIESLMYI